ncbi:MAG: NAD-dependent epimerase/dehydratase family protein [Candidatus Diapherotrites archaeon]|nr:NAD-dependent epimerase/dehydratase family protein [Candidatus Diapherotrites archaeon]
MKAVVTGGAGFIGSNLALELEAQGHEVVVIDNLFSGNMANLEGFSGDFVNADIREINWNEIAGDADAIFHNAAITDTTIPDKELMMDVNAHSFEKLLEFAIKKNIKVIYASSAATYGSGKMPMEESQKPAPLIDYGASKVEMDNIAKKYIAKYPDAEIIGLRYFNVFGPREKFKGKSSSLTYQWIIKMQDPEAKTIKMFKFGEHARDHIYVKDIVSANLKALEFNGSDIFNVGTGIGTSYNRILEILNGQMGKNCRPEYIDCFLKTYQGFTQADTTKAEKELKFRAQWNIERGIGDYIEFLGKEY